MDERRVYREFLEWKAKKMAEHLIFVDNRLKRVVDVPQAARMRYTPLGGENRSRELCCRVHQYRYENAVMATFTYDTKVVPIDLAWSGCSSETRRVIRDLNRRRYRRCRRGLSYVWTVEAQKETHYPHSHVLFPGLRWLADNADLEGLWNLGYTHVERFEGSAADYVAKYATKVSEFPPVGKAVFWSKGLRSFGFSRDYPPVARRSGGDVVFIRSVSADRLPVVFENLTSQLRSGSS